MEELLCADFCSGFQSDGCVSEGPVAFSVEPGSPAPLSVWVRMVAQLSKQWRWQHNDNNNSNRLAFRKRVLTTVLRPNQTNVPFVSDSPWVDLLSYWISSGRSYLKGFWMDPWGLPLEGRTRPSTKRCSVSAFLVKCQRKKQKSLQGKL